MSQNFISLALLALAGFLIGGAYSMWKTTKPIAVLLGVGALLSGAGALAWMV